MGQGSFSQAGFYYQNNLAALNILELLETNPDVLEVHLENFSRGPHIDDIILTRKQQVDYIQVKWSSDSQKAYTLSNLALEKDVKGDCLWAKLARGHMGKQQHGKVSKIYLHSTRVAGISKKEGVDKSLKQLVAFQERFCRSGCTDLEQMEDYAEFAGVLAMLQRESGLEEKDFLEFFRSLGFQLGQSDLSHLRQQLERRADHLGLDLTQVDKLLDLVVNWSISGEGISRDTLLRGLGIDHRFQDRLSHVFKVDELLYIGNEALFADLDRAISAHDGGYILVEGVPGAGKSTVLTKYFRQNAQVRFAYYCFIPGDSLTANDRLDASFFLKSLCIAIEQCFPRLELPIRYSQDYGDKLGRYLEVLAAKGEKVVMLIDGLDHVHRGREYLKDPLTGSILADLPENIYFILSSQYVEALPPRVRASIASEPGRHLKIGPFDLAKVREYAWRRGLELTEKQMSTLYETSGGIPLYLYYITSSLLETDRRGRAGLMKSFPKLVGGKIGTYHTLLYQELSKDPLVVWMLALLAHRREYTSLELMLEILRAADVSCDLATLGVKLSGFRHLLKERNGTGFCIFHNSFREYLLAETAHLSLALNQALADFYAGDIFAEDAFRNYFRHLSEMERFGEVLKLVDDGWISSAWAKYHPVAKIMDNIDLAWWAAVQLQDLTAFVRIAFLKHQLQVSAHNLDSSGFDNSLYFLSGGMAAESLQTLWDGELPLLQEVAFFNHYAVAYAERMGMLVPRAIAEVFFQLFRDRVQQQDVWQRDAPDLSGYFRARSLYLNPDGLLEELRTKWGRQITDQGLRELFAFLAGRRKLAHLLLLERELKHDGLKCSCIAQLIPALYLKDTVKAGEKLAGLEIGTLKPAEKNGFLLALLAKAGIAASGQLLDKVSLKVRTVAPLIEHQRGDPALKKEFLELYDQLRIYYLKDPENYARFRKKIKKLDDYLYRLHKGMSRAAKLWADHQRGTIPEKLVEKLCVIIDLVCLYSHDWYYLSTDYGRDSMLKYELHRIHRQLFGLFTQLCDTVQLGELTAYWIGHGNAFQDYRSYLHLAAALLDSGKELAVSIGRLLVRAEELARISESTSSLVESLYQVGCAYGRAGMMEDHGRLYRELLALSCGLSYRKDYQFSDIFVLLPKLHAIDAGGSRQRIADLYHLLQKVRDVGNPRMFHICLSYLIRHVAMIFPSLGLEMALREDMEMIRDEAMGIWAKGLIATALPDELSLVWALVRTMSKWENFRDGEESDSGRLYRKLLARMAEHGQQAKIGQIYRYLYRQFDVEHANPERIYGLNRVLEEKGMTASFLVRPQTETKEVELEAPGRKREKFIRTPVPLGLDGLRLLLRGGLSELRKYIRDFVRDREYDKATPIWTKVYGLGMEVLLPWAAGLDPLQRETLERHHFGLKRMFLSQKECYARLRKPDKATLSALLTGPLDKIQQLFPELEALAELEGKLELGKLVDGVYAELTRYRSRIYHAVSEEDILALTAEAEYGLERDWLAFLPDYFSPEVVVPCMVNLSKNVWVYDEEVSREILSDAFLRLEGIDYRPSGIERKVLDWAYECLPEMANGFVLRSFYSGHQQPTSSLMYDVGEQIEPYHGHFSEPGFYEGYYQANYGYNLKLAEGLSEPSVELQFIFDHRESDGLTGAVLRYLIAMLDYPVVKTRGLVLGSLLELYGEFPEMVTALLLETMRLGKPNQIEQLISLLHSLAEKVPEEVGGMILACKDLIGSAHYNIRLTFADLVLFVRKKGVLLDEGLLHRAAGANHLPLVAGLIAEGPIIGRIHPGYRSSQNELYSFLEEMRHTGNSVAARLKAYYENCGYQERLLDARENAVIKKYNKNANWDPIEISGPGFQAMREGLNHVAGQLLSERGLEQGQLAQLARTFRLQDPTDQYAEWVKIPAAVEWNSTNLEEKDFLAFADVDRLMGQFVLRDAKKVALFEQGYQGMELHPSKFTTYFEAGFFLADGQMDPAALEALLTDRAPFRYCDNLYRTELYGHFGQFLEEEELLAGVQPMVVVSQRNFRDWYDGSIAVLDPILGRAMNLSECPKGLGLSDAQGRRISELVEWQGPYLDLDRRRFEPKSRGCTLWIDREMLEGYLATIGKSLFLYVRLKRSTDRFMPEQEMSWKHGIFVRAIKS